MFWNNGNQREKKRDIDTLWEFNVANWKNTMFNGKIHYK
jgi:hypothetical protein